MILDIVSSGDDWVQTYINGSIRNSDHSVPVWDWYDLVLLPITEVRRWEYDSDELDYPPDFIDFDNLEKQGLKFERVD